MNAPKDILMNEIQSHYEWLDAQIALLGRGCQACGQCCDFERYGHRLYVSTPEVIYFEHFARPEIRAMPSQVCPYRIDNKCTAYAYRFSGCRIFDCRTDGIAQSRLSEQTLRHFKGLCQKFDLQYRYVYLKEALTLLSENNFPLA